MTYWPEAQIDGDVCSSANCRAESDARSASYQRALAASYSIETFSKNYKGRVPADPRSGQEVSSSWYKSQEDADKELRVQAALVQCDVVFDVSCEKREATSGNYRYSEWRKAGTAGRRL